MESVWKHSSPVHAGEFFHGACEVFGRETAVVAFLGLGKYRPVEERAVKFLQRITDKLTVLDAAALDLDALPAWTGRMSRRSSCTAWPRSTACSCPTPWAIRCPRAGIWASRSFKARKEGGLQ